MKKIIASIIVLAMLAGVSGCASSPSTTTAAGTTAAGTTAAGTTAAGTTAAGTTAAGTTAAGDTKTYHFEIVSKGFQSTYWQAVFKGSTAELKALNDKAGYEKYTMNFVGPDAESDIAVQVQEFTSAMNAKPAAIGLAALDVNSLLDQIKTAQTAGIPIIGFDSGVPAAPAGAVLANAATDNYAAGQLAATSMYKKISARIGNGVVRIGEINQDATSESVTNRGLGFIDKMIELITADGHTVAVTGNEKYVGGAKGTTVDASKANVVIEVRVPSATTTELCATEAGVILNEKDTIAVFGSNQTAAEGIITANETLNVCGSADTQIIAVGFDSGSVLKAAVTAGTMYGAITQAPVAIGTILIDLLAKSAAGESVSNTDTGCQFYTVDNIASTEIAQNLYD